MIPTEQGIAIFIGVIVSAIVTLAWVVIRDARERRQHQQRQEFIALDRGFSARLEEAMERERTFQHQLAELEAMQQRLAAARRNRAAAGGMRRRIARQTSIGVHMRNKNRRPHRALDREFGLLRGPQ